MTRRERLERKLEKRLEWADKRRARADAVAHEADKYRGDVAFNTQPGHIPARARLIARQERAFEDVKMAQHHESRASGLEHQLETSIFSDDEDAPDRLRERIRQLEEKREKMKRVNKAFRKGDEAFAEAAGIELATAKRLREKIEADFSWLRQPHPTYELTNLGANIRRLQQRVKDVETRRARTEKADAASGGVLIEPLGDRGWVRVTFAEKPAREILDALRSAGFSWGAGSWVGATEKLPASVKAMAGEAA